MQGTKDNFQKTQKKQRFDDGYFKNTNTKKKNNNNKQSYKK